MEPLLTRFRHFAVVAVILCLPLLAHAQLSNQPLGGGTGNSLPAYLKDAGVVQRLNQPLPLSAMFVDEQGAPVALGTYFHGRPVALALVYFKCGMLCPQVLHGMAVGLRETGFKAGKDYEVVVESIDPMDTPQDALKAKAEFLDTLGDTGAGGAVHFLTGQSPAIAALSAATGFHYVRVPGPDGKMDQFAHSSVVMFATPDGRLSEYLSGIDYPSRDVRLALVQASARKIATAKDLFLLYCCSYVPASGRYTVAVVRILGLAGILTLAGMVLGLYLLAKKRKTTA